MQGQRHTLKGTPSASRSRVSGGARRTAAAVCLLTRDRSPVVRLRRDKHNAALRILASLLVKDDYLVGEKEWGKTRLAYAFQSRKQVRMQMSAGGPRIWGPVSARVLVLLRCRTKLVLGPQS